MGFLKHFYKVCDITNFDPKTGILRYVKTIYVQVQVLVQVPTFSISVWQADKPSTRPGLLDQRQQPESIEKVTESMLVTCYLILSCKIENILINCQGCLTRHREKRHFVMCCRGTKGEEFHQADNIYGGLLKHLHTQGQTEKIVHL